MKQQQHTYRVLRGCYQRLKNYTGGELRFIGVWSDVYYLPSQLIPDISTVLSFFRKHEVYVDLAVPTAIYCLVQPKEIEPILKFHGRGKIEGEKLRKYFNDFKSSNTHLMHPTKWGLLAENRRSYAQLFCKQVVPFVHHGQ